MTPPSRNELGKIFLRSSIFKFFAAYSIPLEGNLYGTSLGRDWRTLQVSAPNLWHLVGEYKKASWSRSTVVVVFPANYLRARRLLAALSLSYSRPVTWEPGGCWQHCRCHIPGKLPESQTVTGRTVAVIFPANYLRARQLLAGLSLSYSRQITWEPGGCWQHCRCHTPRQCRVTVASASQSPPHSSQWGPEAKSIAIIYNILTTVECGKHCGNLLNINYDEHMFFALSRIWNDRITEYTE